MSTDVNKGVKRNFHIEGRDAVVKEPRPSRQRLLYAGDPSLEEPYVQVRGHLTDSRYKFRALRPGRRCHGKAGPHCW